MAWFFLKISAVLFKKLTLLARRPCRAEGGLFVYPWVGSGVGVGENPPISV